MTVKSMEYATAVAFVPIPRWVRTASNGLQGGAFHVTSAIQGVILQAHFISFLC
jgi:hypothetical protein